MPIACSSCVIAPGTTRSEEERDRGEQAEVVEEDAERARHAAAPVQPLHARPHRRGDHEAEEEQRDDEPDLPERERGDDDRDDDERRVAARRAVSPISRGIPCSQLERSRTMDDSTSASRRAGTGSCSRARCCARFLLALAGAACFLAPWTAVAAAGAALLGSPRCSPSSGCALGPDAPRRHRERARRRARVPAPQQRVGLAQRHGSRSSSRCSAASSATARSSPASSRSTACRGGSRACSSSADSPSRTSVRPGRMPPHGCRRACRPRRPRAQPEGHHRPPAAEPPHLHHRAVRLRQVVASPSTRSTRRASAATSSRSPRTRASSCR